MKLTCLNVSLGTALAWHFLRYSSQEKSSSFSSSDPEQTKQNVLIAITYGQKENENIIQTFDLQYKITKSLNTKFFLHCLIKKNK